MEPVPLLVVESDPARADELRRILQELPIQARVVHDVGAAAEAIRAGLRGEARFRVALLDADASFDRAPAMLDSMRTLDETLRVILVSRRQSGEVGPLALEAGAYDFLAGAWSGAELRIRVERALRDGGKGGSGRAAAGERRARKSDVIIGTSPWTKAIHERIAMVAKTDVTVALSGESGTGKELVARTIHSMSSRADGPFVVVNCGAIPEALLENELFGHVKGAFTDATKDREGLLASADGGTLFLDEIGEMPLSLQVKLLRVLQSHEFRRIGDNRDLRVDVRVVTATNRDLEQAVQTGRFREDLYYRITVFPITLPPLRQRKEDIPLLAQHFLVKHRAEIGKRALGFRPEAMAKLLAYDWPGNVRELENKISHALVVASGERIRPEELPLPAPAAPPTGSLDLSKPFRELKREVVGEFERQYAHALLRRHAGNVAAAARQARVDRKNFWDLLKKHRLDPKAFRS